MASLRFVSQKYVSPTAQADISAYLTTLQPTSSAVRALNPYATNAWNYFGVLYGNAFSSEQGFSTVGQVTQGGAAWDKDNNVFPWFSASKILTASVFAKMVEEGLMNPNDLISSYISTGFSGNVVYITNGSYPATAINTNSQPGNPAAWTVSTGTFDASVLTLNCLLNFNYGAMYDSYQYGLIGQEYTLNSTGVVNNDLVAGVEYGKNIVYSAYKANQYVLANKSTNFMYQALTGADVSYTTSLNNYLAAVANGTIPLAFKSNTNATNGPTFGGSSSANTNSTQQPPFYVTAQLQQYSLVYEILAYAMDIKIRQLYASNPVTYPYANFAAYARAKILTPLQMNRSYILNQECPSTTSPIPALPALTYDPAVWLCTPQICRANVSTLGGDLAYTNLLSSSNAQNVTIAAQYSTATGAVNLPWAVLYGNNVSNTLTSVAGTGYTYNVSDDSFAKYATYLVRGPANAADAPVGGFPLCGPITDLAKLLVCLLNGGKNQAGQRVLNTQTVNWLFSTRTCGLTPVNAPNTMAPINATFQMGLSNAAKFSNANSTDALNNLETYELAGESSCKIALDRTTGYYFIYGTNIVNIWNYTYSANLPTDTNLIRLIMNKNS